MAIVRGVTEIEKSIKDGSVPYMVRMGFMGHDAPLHEWDVEWFIDEDMISQLDLSCISEQDRKQLCLQFIDAQPISDEQKKSLKIMYGLISTNPAQPDTSMHEMD